jgi:hypothetical protein
MHTHVPAALASGWSRRISCSKLSIVVGRAFVKDAWHMQVYAYRGTRALGVHAYIEAAMRQQAASLLARITPGLGKNVLYVAES